IERQGARPLAGAAAEIDAVAPGEAGRDDLARVVAHLQLGSEPVPGASVPFQLDSTQDRRDSSRVIGEISQSGLGLPAGGDQRRTLEMVERIEQAMERDLRELPWMSEAARGQALIKLHAVANKIGYPEHWRDYGALRITRDDYAGNMMRAAEFERRRRLA